MPVSYRHPNALNFVNVFRADVRIVHITHCAWSDTLPLSVQRDNALAANGYEERSGDQIVWASVGQGFQVNSATIS